MTVNYAQLWEAREGTNLFLPLKARTHREMMTRHVLGRRPVVMLLAKGQDTFLLASSDATHKLGPTAVTITWPNIFES